MRITKLSIKKYKNLENFEWELNPDYPVAVIVGKNGSGKTNLLEAIITIFQDLQLYDEERKQNTLPEFEFEIEYLYGDDTIVIKNEKTIEIKKNGEIVSLGQLQTLHQDILQGTEILPENIFVYYAGNTIRIQQLAEKSISEYKNLLIDIANNKIKRQFLPKQPLFYYDLIHHRIVFLTLLLSSLENIQTKFLSDDLKIENLESAHLVILRPDWKENSPKWKKISTDTESFWDAPVYLRRILEIIRETALLETSDDPSEIRFEISGEDLRETFSETYNEKDFFQQLSNLVLANYLTDIKIHFRKKEVEKTLEFSELSEGEWQRIAIRGAMEIYRGEKVLFLLDEPDTFAHPRWQWEFIPDINEAIQSEEKNMQVIFITHSPLVLSTAKDNDFMMTNGGISSIDKKLYGEKLEIVLTEMHGDSDKVEDDFKSYFELIEKGNGESPEALEIRKELEERYGVNHSEISRADMWIAFYK